MNRTNVVVILNDDMGYSDLGCYGGEVNTPNLDRLSANGVRFTQFYNTPRCSPSRASLLTGLYPHQTGVGILTQNQLPDGYEGDLRRDCPTMAEVLRSHGYATYMSGKWHVANDWFADRSNWPRQRGFDRFYGLIAGAASYYNPVTLTRDNDNIESEAQTPGYYLTDAISDNAVMFIRDHVRRRSNDPFFLYVTYTAPHWPLHALPEDVAKYRGRFDSGWDTLRRERLSRMSEAGIVDPSWKLTPRDSSQPAWEEAPHKEWERRRMEVYAAQIDRMDQGIGRVIAALESNGQLENTLIFFLSDNGGCAEVLLPPAPWLVAGHLARTTTKDGTFVRIGNDPGVMPGNEDSYQSYGVAWANLSNTPFRLYKHWTHEGGISTPLIVHWPAGIPAQGELRHTPTQLIDIMATVADVTGAPHPAGRDGSSAPPLEGHSLQSVFVDDSLPERIIFWEHEGNAAVRHGRWKLVRDFPGGWELYDMAKDRTELHDLASKYPDRVREMAGAYDAWATRCEVIPREKILDYMKRQGSAP